MNVNRPDADVIKAQALNLRQNAAKVDLGKDDLEVLWQNAKLTEDSSLFENVSDEDGIAMFDLLDNEGNNAETSYKLLMNWLKSQTGDGADAQAVTLASTQTQETSTASATLADSNEPVVDELAAQSNVLSSETPVTLAAAEVSTEVQRTFDRLLPNQSKTIEVNGKSYTLENASKTVNNFAYYIEGGKLIVEGSDLKLTSADNTELNDDVKMMGNRNTIDVGNGDDIIEVEGAMNMVYGGSGNDHVMLRGDYNTTDMGDGDDTVWMAGNNNTAMGQKGADNFFAIGSENTFFGQDGIDASYYNETEGVGHEFRVEDKITDATDFEKWVKGEEADDGPPYVKPPEALDGHEVRAYDDNTYTDKYEQEPLYYTEYRDIAYRELDAMTTENKITGEGTVLTYNDDASEKSSIAIASDGSVTVKANGESVVIAKDDVVYYDQDGNAVRNPGALSDILEKLATGKLSVGNKDGVITPGAGSGGEVTEPETPATPVEPEVPDTPATPDTPVVPEEPQVSLPTTSEIADMISDFTTDIANKLTEAGNEYSAAMSNRNSDGTFDTSDDAFASQQYASTVNTLNTKKQVVVNTGLPLINTASSIYAGASDKTDEYYSQLYELTMKTLEANRNYFLNNDEEAEDELKAEADKANEELQNLINSKS